MTPVRVLVADDHPVFRDGLAMLLGSVRRHRGGGHRGRTAPEAVALAARAAARRRRHGRADAGLDGIEATRRLAAEAPSVGVVVLTMSEDDGTVFAAVRAGARGYLLKGAEQEEIVRAITTVAAGGAVFGAALARRIAEFFAAGPAAPTEAFPQLTAREREVLDLLAAGRSNAADRRARSSCRRRRCATTCPTCSPSCRSPTGPRRSSGPARRASDAERRPAF